MRINEQPHPPPTIRQHPTIQPPNSQLATACTQGRPNTEQEAVCLFLAIVQILQTLRFWCLVFFIHTFGDGDLSSSLSLMF